jgi:uncharacterized membrane protein YedE/YeeE
VPIVLGSVEFVLALAVVGVMGFAIQRGATCTVAAVDELVARRSARRLASLVEAALWVAGCLLVVQALRWSPRVPAGYAISGWTILGGALLGLGAWVNRACVFGSIARFGSGQWAQLAMPLGYFLGCVSLRILLMPPPRPPLEQMSPVLQAPAWVAMLFVLFVAFRLSGPLIAPQGEGPRPPLRQRIRGALATRVWTPHAATSVIGVAFFLSLMLAGAWGYTDLLADLARGGAMGVAARCLLALALLAGAAWGGWTAGLFRSTLVTAGQVARSMLGGALMGWGTLLIPGSNDGLILLGMPLLWPYAWLAFATMCATIAIAMRIAAHRGTSPASIR